MPDDVTSAVTEAFAEQGAPESTSEPANPTTSEPEASAPTDPTTTSAAEALDLEQYGDRLVTVKVGGQEQQLPLKEAIAAGMRQADYTQKTQSLAEKQRELDFAASMAAALERNPEATLDFLRTQYLGDGNPQGTEPEFLTPEEERLSNVEAALRQQQEFQEEQQLRQEISTLHDQFGDFDESELLQHALQIGAPNLRTAYADWQLPTLLDEVKPLRDAHAKREADRAAQEQAALDAKRGAGAVVNSGHGVTPGSVQSGTTEAMSLEDSFRAAYRENVG